MKAENDNKKGFTLPYGEYSFDQWYYWVKTASFSEIGASHWSQCLIVKVSSICPKSRVLTQQFHIEYNLGNISNGLYIC